MSTTKSSGTCAAFGSPQPELFGEPAVITESRRDGISLPFGNRADNGTGSRFSEQFLTAGIGLGPDEENELRVFDEFLAQHIQQNGICDVQCMLLWSEWVRAFRRRVRGFPALIREQEFRHVIMDRYGVGIANDGFRGAVYPGLRFMP